MMFTDVIMYTFPFIFNIYMFWYLHDYMLIMFTYSLSKQSLESSQLVFPYLSMMMIRLDPSPSPAFSRQWRQLQVQLLFSNSISNQTHLDFHSVRSWALLSSSKLCRAPTRGLSYLEPPPFSTQHISPNILAPLVLYRPP